MDLLNKAIGNYRIIRMIGEGGMAIVFEGEHLFLGTRAAIKVLKSDFSSDLEIRDRFINEARLMASLDHPNIAKIISFENNNNYLAIIMELLVGQDLKERILQNGPLHETTAEKIFTQVLDAFSFAHSKGIIHRDIKPSNIFLLPNDEVKILDFGIAKLLGANMEMTQTGVQMGTPIYMSPEQVKADKNIDHRTDIYSLGVTLNFALTGKAPYDFNTESHYSIYHRIVSEPFPVYDGKFTTLIQKACEKNPNDRFDSCLEWKDSLIKREIVKIKQTTKKKEVIKVKNENVGGSKFFNLFFGLSSFLGIVLTFLVIVGVVILYINYQDTRGLYWRSSISQYQKLLTDEVFIGMLIFSLANAIGGFVFRRRKVFTIVSFLLLIVSIYEYKSIVRSYDNFWEPVQEAWCSDDSYINMFSVLGVPFHFIEEKWASQTITTDSINSLKVKYLILNDLNKIRELAVNDDLNAASDYFLSNSDVDLDVSRLNELMERNDLSVEAFSSLSRRGEFGKLKDMDEEEYVSLIPIMESYNSTPYMLRYKRCYVIGLWDNNLNEYISKIKFIKIEKLHRLVIKKRD